jgi:hypothetical protein
MDANRKLAYRFVIYWGMLDIRRLQNDIDRPLRLLNPIRLYRTWRHAQRAGATAEWLHNAAHFSTFDFEDFREDWFWNEHDRLVERFGNDFNYRDVFEARLKDSGRPLGV